MPGERPRTAISTNCRIGYSRPGARQATAAHGHRVEDGGLGALGLLGREREEEAARHVVAGPAPAG